MACVRLIALGWNFRPLGGGHLGVFLGVGLRPGALFLFGRRNRRPADGVRVRFAFKSVKADHDRDAFGLPRRAARDRSQASISDAGHQAVRSEILIGKGKPCERCFLCKSLRLETILRDFRSA
jgi:hypothetical protein